MPIRTVGVQVTIFIWCFWKVQVSFKSQEYIFISENWPFFTFREMVDHIVILWPFPVKLIQNGKTWPILRESFQRFVEISTAYATRSEVNTFDLIKFSIRIQLRIPTIIVFPILNHCFYILRTNWKPGDRHYANISNNHCHFNSQRSKLALQMKLSSNS